MLVQEAIEVPAQAEQLPAIHAALQRFWEAADGVLDLAPDPSWSLRFATAVAEIAANIAQYAYPSSSTPGAMRLCLRTYPNRVEAVFADGGAPYTGSAEAAMPDPLSLAEGGYGLALARVALDRLDYSRTEDGTNQWRLVKRLAT